MIIRVRFALLSTFLLFGLMSVAQTKTIAHRGYWDYPGSAQNSISALYKAHEIKVYGSEFDVSVTADGIPVVNHDSDIQGFVIEKSNYANLRDIKLPNGEILPTLEQYLVHGNVNKDTKLILEIKPHSSKEVEDRAVQAILQLVKAKQLEEQTEYISFSKNICLMIKQTDPSAIVHYLNGELSPKEIKEIGLDGIDYHLSVYKNNPGWINEAKQLGLKTNVWTVNNPEDMKYMIGQGVDYITTDKPQLLQDILLKKD